MTAAALKRVKAFITGLGPYAVASNDRLEYLKVEDLRAVLRLAERAAELERRRREALAAIPSQHVSLNVDDAGEALFGYSRVSERTILRIERALKQPHGRALSPTKPRGRKGRR